MTSCVCVCVCVCAIFCREYIETLAVPELKRRLALMSVDCSKCLEKTELCDLLFKSEETLLEKPGPSWHECTGCDV